ncbi:uncharacterized protein LOC125061670 [Pieris napi]|uniref:uncharacterized protein LOC125061670 n=1 Tax=Pieris napi TaxID=78633 RepID=UPI001FB91536|nr:uncharacterized protein LOC125061670 [Pieris napi]
MENLFQASFTDGLKTIRHSRKTEELLRKQAALFRWSDRMLELSNVHSASDKYDLEGVLEDIKLQWDMIFKTHIEIDADLQGSYSEYQNKYYEKKAIYRRLKRKIYLKLRSLETHMDSPVLYSHNSENSSLYALETANNQTREYLNTKQQRPSSNFSISKNSLSTHFDIQGQGNANLNCNSTQGEQSFQYKSDKKNSSSSAMVEGLAESGNNHSIQQIPSGIAMMPIQKTTDVQQETSIVALAEAVAASLGVDSKEPTRYWTPIGLSVNHSIHADTYQGGELSKLAESGAQSLTDYSKEQHSIISGVGETLNHSTDHQTQLGCEVSGEDKSHRVNVGIKSMKCLQDKQETEDKEILSSSISYKKNKNLNSSLVLSKPLLEAPIQLYTEPYLQHNLTQGSDIVVRKNSIISRKSYGKFSHGHGHSPKQ